MRGDNDEFMGVTREQRMIVATELHLVRRFSPGFWATLDLNFYEGGRSTFGGELAADLQRNSRLGGTVVFPFGGRHAIKAAYSTGVVTKSGGDFESFLLSYQVLLKQELKRSTKAFHLGFQVPSRYSHQITFGGVSMAFVFFLVLVVYYER